MPKFTHISAIALKDESHVLGIVAKLDQMIEIDVTDRQLPLVQAAVDSGDIDADGFVAKGGSDKADKAKK